MPVERPILSELQPHVADPIRQDGAFSELFLFEAGSASDTSHNPQEPLPLHDSLEQQLPEKRPQIENLPNQIIHDPILPFQGDGTRFDQPKFDGAKRSITIVAFGDDAVRLTKKHPPLPSTRS